MTLTLVRGAKDAPKNVRSKMETLLVSLAEIERWKLPNFQRPLRENDKVRALAEQLKGCDGGCVPGVVTLGRLEGDPTLWVVDGQHRLHAFKLSGLPEVIIDVRICDFDSVEEMALAFVELQSALVRMRPDDVLRGLEGTSVALQRIRKACSYVGYDQLRRGTGSGPILSMSGVIRNWMGSVTDVPKSSSGSSVALAHALDPEETKRLIVFLDRAHVSWGRDPEYYRLWSGLNMTMCMWLWRRLVLHTGLTGTSRWTTLTSDEYANCMVALTSDQTYLTFLQGKALVDLHRNPTYRHIKRIFLKRMMDAHGKKIMFPQPAWVQN
jgi:hypothetical protein